MQKIYRLLEQRHWKFFFLSFLLEYNEKNNTESFLSSEIIGITLLS